MKLTTFVESSYSTYNIMLTQQFKKLALVGAFCMVGATATAQQDAQYSQYMYSPLYLNPAAAGGDGKNIEFGITHRQQWLGYTASFDQGGSPVSFMGFASVPLRFLHGGVGLVVQNDRLGPINNFSMVMSYAFREEVQNGYVSAGIQAGIYSMGLDFSILRFREGGDPLEGKGNQTQMRPDFGIGIQLTKKKYNIGFSINHVLRPTFSFAGAADAARLNYHGNLMGGVNFDINENITVRPSALIRTDFKTFSAQASVMGSYQEKFHVGVGLRNSMNVDDAIAFIGFNPTKALHIGYSFDYVVSGVAAKAPTSHEVILRYTIPMLMPVLPPIIRTPRFRK
jgi:type IX secretion system PorP/SprF family membrane protein